MEEYALSLGLSTLPRLRFLKRGTKELLSEPLPEQHSCRPASLVTAREAGSPEFRMAELPVREYQLSLGLSTLPPLRCLKHGAKKLPTEPVMEQQRYSLCQPQPMSAGLKEFARPATEHALSLRLFTLSRLCPPLSTGQEVTASCWPP